MSDIIPVSMLLNLSPRYAQLYRFYLRYKLQRDNVALDIQTMPGVHEDKHVRTRYRTNYYKQLKLFYDYNMIINRLLDDMQPYERGEKF